MSIDINLINTVGPTGFKELLAANGIQDTTIQAGGKGLIIALKVDGKDFVLGRQRGGPRYFYSVDGAASVLIQHGITGFYVDTTGWLPRTLTKNKKRQSLLGGASGDI